MKKQDLLDLVRGKLLAAGVQASDNLVLAVSGGPDSMTLLDAMRSLQSDFNLQLTVVHVNHGLRKEANKDQKLVEDYCKKYDLFLIIKSVDVKKHLGKNRGGMEEKARELRYRALRQVASKMRARFVVTAHHQDDQVETIILNFLRGGGLRGLGGMREVSGDILRPLLSVPKVDLLRYLRQRKISFVVDTTNKDLGITRNRIRHKLLPILREYNPNLDKLLVQNSYIFSQADIVLDNLAQHYLSSMGDSKADKVSISISKLTELSPLMQVEVLKAAIRRVLGSLQHLKKVHFDEIFKLLVSDKAKSSKRLPGKLFVTKAYDKITISCV